MVELQLTIELVPEKSWGKSLAQLLPKIEWDKLRKATYKRFNWQCQACGAVGVRVHCHEVWSYDDRRKIQKLVALTCLCEDCHNIKHWGRTIQLLHQGQYSQAYIDKLRDHFCEVNKCTLKEMLEHIAEMGDKNMKRSRYQYTINFSHLPDIVKEIQKCIKLRSKFLS